MTFFRKTGAKVACSILCITSLTVAFVSSLLMALLIASGSYDAGTSPYEHLVANRMISDSNDILFNYFDPNEPQSPWRSYHSGGIYTGENSNFVYKITNEDGKTMLSTYPGKDPTMLEREYTHHFDTTVEVEAEEVNKVTSRVLYIDDSYFLYDEESGYFEPLDAYLGRQMSAQELDISAFDLDTGFSYKGIHYSYNGAYFFPEEDWVNYTVEYTSNAYTITCALREGLPYPDIYRSLNTASGMLMGLRYWIIAITIASALLGIVLLCILGCAVGRVNGKEEPVVGFLYKLPPDLSILCMFLVGACATAFIVELWEVTYLSAMALWDLAALAVIMTMLVYGIMTLCVRCKTHTLVSGSVCYWIVHNIGRICKWAGRLCRQCMGYLPLVWKVAACYGILCLLELIGLAAFFWGDGMLYFLWFMEKLLLGALVGYVTLCFRRLKAGAEHIASGNYNTKVDEKHLVLDFKDTADTLNHIQDGMTAAVESRMRSERLKTELITNVSHDLKTPLTSIVSYVDLLKQEPIGSEAAGEYLEVLDRQSQRLKKLIEDLVEASKASTGNITVAKEPLDFVMLLGQALGEYSQRLMTAELNPVLHLPDTPAMVLADGRLLWRVFDNLLGNIVKYAMPGTRVYISADMDGAVTATFRNISRDALDVSADELMERFVRGDASRHTEGSGLGLSIARSLTESMGGTFQLSVDGDLFKAMVTFPLLTEIPTAEPPQAPAL